MPNLAGSSTQHSPRVKPSQQNSPAKSELQATSSASPVKYPRQVRGGIDKKSDHLVEQSPAEKRKLSSISRIPVRREQPSVADLRKSFEKGLQSPKVSPQTPSKPKQSTEKIPDCTPRNGDEMPLSSGSIQQDSTPSIQTARNNKGAHIQPSGTTGQTTHLNFKNQCSEQSLLTQNSIDTIKHTPRVSLPKSSRFRQRDTHNLDGTTSFEYDAMEPDEAYATNAYRFPETGGGKIYPFTDSIHPFLSTSSIGNFHDEIRGDGPLLHEETVPRDSNRVTQKPASKSGAVLRCTGKVSDLRRLFERTPARCASPNPFKSFWQSRSRNKPKVEVEGVPVTRYDPAGSAATSTTHISPPKRISPPKLTTAISTNDFSCDFAAPGALGNAISMKHKARFDIEPEESDENMSAEQGSPVKGRIQQFERLERGPPAPSSASSFRADSYGANMSSSLKRKESDAKQVKTRGSWRPFRQRSVELWRRISSSFVRSAGEEQTGPSNYDADLGSGLSSLRRRLRYRRSDILSYYLYRSSEVVRSPTTSSSSKSSDSINDDLVAETENQAPHPARKRSPSRDVSISKTFPFLARMSDSLGCTDEFDDFGFDGSLLSKATRYRTKSPAGDVLQSSSSITPRGDPNTLSRVVSQQTVAERKRRRQEEKQLRREQRDQKREEKAKFKGKGKVTGNKRSDNDGKEVVTTQDKGKQKEVEGKKKESSWSKKTASGFVVRQINDVKLRHPKPRRPGQVKKLVNMYKEKASSGIKLGKGVGASSGSGIGAAGPSNH
ncbi:uncharacterized protein GGS22DRAFT_82291 [Annulohypoxylon maeteangense]|uniref:uncharacterized protein n=1 Tax=Annulohypoxylon maeteangense TaxID=1927788 RepID=UPI002007A258|nr:uncharacterized protein GGS22DRAFT_82291 [Annulohypoxylon maeteangense]KAI0880711.1 hypothetical protein GGS22DRAFT_82291 [Annulohypoxylon maeteangense]